VLSCNIVDELFPPERQLLPNLNDLYELELALYEHMLMSDEELARNGAYFAKVNGSYTRHFLMCTGEPLKLPDHSSSRLKSFFVKNLFRTGYATHGLFPYRGKFHPQMIKGIINAMGLTPGDTVLDPMMGSGTVAVEAALMGINSAGIDASPFCRFMAQTKIDTLTMSLTRARKAQGNYKEIFEYFRKRVGKPLAGSKTRKSPAKKSFMSVMEPAAEYFASGNTEALSKKKREDLETYNFLLLAYLDASGYAERSGRRSPIEQFKAVLERYLFVAEKIQAILKGVESDLGTAEILEGDARALSLDDESIDGIVFSPPYSFAIDYLKNDSFHLNFLGVDIEDLRTRMIGLRGRGLAAKVESYMEDMDQILSECARVLRKGRICTIVVGTNNNQLSKVLGVPPEKVPGLHTMLIERAAAHGMNLVKLMSRPIVGMSNTMRKEYIVMLARES